MSRDIAKILKNQKKRRLLGEPDPKLNFVLSYLLQEEVSDYLEKVRKDFDNELKAYYLEKIKKDCDNELKTLEGQVSNKIQKVKDGYTPVKGKDYFDGKNADEIKIIRSVLSKIRIPKDGEPGKDANEGNIIKKILSKIKIPKDGDPGKNGEPGKDGSPDNPKQIANKLNTLEEKVEMGVIKGLKNYFDNFNKKLQSIKSGQSSKGGGMGNVIHKTFDVSSATTTSSLDTKVAADGNAIWAYYQGQFLVKGTHYTISGSTITWLETFSDDTFVDITYVRA